MLTVSKCHKFKRCIRGVMLRALPLLFPHPTESKAVELFAVGVNVVVCMGGEDRGPDDFASGNKDSVAESESFANDQTGNGDCSQWLKDKERTVTKGIQTKCFFNERIQFPHFHNGSFCPPIFLDCSFQFASQGLGIFWIPRQII